MVRHTRRKPRAAGTVFANRTHVLAGYQSRKRVPFISGIGGLRQPGESALECALRETVEELFEVSPIPIGLLRRLQAELPARSTIRKEGFTMFLYTMEDLLQLLQIVGDYGIGSPLYEEGIPRCLSDLLFYRIVPEDSETQPELSHLTLLPLVAHRSGPMVAPYFVEDMAAIVEKQRTL